MTEERDRPVQIDAELRQYLAERGLVIVPLTPTDAMLSIEDEDGTSVWGGGTEHYFPTRECGHDYAREVWLLMARTGAI